MQQTLFQNCLYHKKLELLEIATKKETQKPLYCEYLLCLLSNASGRFLQKCINFAEQRLKFSHFEGSIKQILGRALLFARNFAKAVPFHKIATPGN